MATLLPPIVVVSLFVTVLLIVASGIDFVMFLSIATALSTTASIVLLVYVATVAAGTVAAGTDAFSGFFSGSETEVAVVVLRISLGSIALAGSEVGYLGVSLAGSFVGNFVGYFTGYLTGYFASSPIETFGVSLAGSFVASLTASTGC